MESFVNIIETNNRKLHKYKLWNFQIGNPQRKAISCRQHKNHFKDPSCTCKPKRKVKNLKDVKYTSIYTEHKKFGSPR